MPRLRTAVAPDGGRADREKRDGPRPVAGERRRSARTSLNARTERLMALRSSLSAKSQSGPHAHCLAPVLEVALGASLKDPPGYLPLGLLVFGFGDADFATFGLAFFIWLS